jgi:hypothetical protein
MTEVAISGRGAVRVDDCGIGSVQLHHCGKRYFRSFLRVDSNSRKRLAVVSGHAILKRASEVVMVGKSVHHIIAAGLPLIATGFCTVAFAHSGGGGSSGSGHGGEYGHGGHRGATHRSSDHFGRRYRGWRGAGSDYGWYSGRFYGGPGRLGYGLFLATLPWYCETYQWGGVPFYYADDNYYQWNSSAGAYETVQPPPGLVDQVQAQAPAMRELFIFPEAGQSNRQLARDREDCQRLAATQVGFDPRTPAAGSAGPPATNLSSANAPAARLAEYLRADGACLMARNYSVE